ncbi:hypothetical protein CDEST_07911 [Colletotrichum destructivum]|uniref:Uncharacterized protein n=1 Tax=Colletotrichum destructivum TaxID=34406 RepID=A0AAX4IHW6_9PEZI|nr:hypothetical protein CDEST_07911 [Colletotrichum destructivum]
MALAVGIGIGMAIITTVIAIDGYVLYRKRQLKKKGDPEAPSGADLQPTDSSQPGEQSNGPQRKDPDVSHTNFQAEMAETSIQHGEQPLKKTKSRDRESLKKKVMDDAERKAEDKAQDERAWL